MTPIIFSVSEIPSAKISCQLHRSRSIVKKNIKENGIILELFPYRLQREMELARRSLA